MGKGRTVFPKISEKNKLQREKARIKIVFSREGFFSVGSLITNKCTMETEDVRVLLNTPFHLLDYNQKAR